jgi:hypothetical protein
MGNEDPGPVNDPESLRELLGENGVRSYYDGVYGSIWIQMYPNEPIPRITLKVANVQCCDEGCHTLLGCLHDAFVDCDRVGVQACACYDVQGMQKPGFSHAKIIIKWMGDKNTPDGNREELIQNVVRAVAVVLVNTWVGVIVKGLVSFIDAAVKPEQPNKVFFNESGVGPFLSDAIQGRANASRPWACNRVAGHVLRGNLVDGSESCSQLVNAPSPAPSPPESPPASVGRSLSIDSPTKGITPSTSASGSATSDADKTPTAVVILPQEDEDAVVDEAIVKPLACGWFRWFACGLPVACPATVVDDAHVVVHR